jgi:hypothetical protein
MIQSRATRSMKVVFTDWEWTKRRQFASRTTTVTNPAAIFDASGNANLSAADTCWK